MHEVYYFELGGKREIFFSEFVLDSARDKSLDNQVISSL
jgi:hypothetical protein